jgi:calcineurin-like phosphoesterase family protein
MPRNTGRHHSNKVLRKYLKHLGGVIINVSGWKDEDKAGGVYRDYYKEIEQYTISNIGGLHGMPEYKDPKTIGLNLIFVSL